MSRALGYAERIGVRARSVLTHSRFLALFRRQAATSGGTFSERSAPSGLTPASKRILTPVTEPA